MGSHRVGCSFAGRGHPMSCKRPASRRVGMGLSIVLRALISILSPDGPGLRPDLLPDCASIRRLIIGSYPNAVFSLRNSCSSAIAVNGSPDFRNFAITYNSDRSKAYLIEASGFLRSLQSCCFGQFRTLPRSVASLPSPPYVRKRERIQRCKSARE